ncbi:MAG: response regulator [bacterium]
MFERGNVCVIDNAVGFLEGFSRLLEWRGYRILPYTSAENAFEDIQNGDFDAVISDVMMPGLTGLELARRLKEIGCKIPVVLMSAHLDSDVKNKAKEYGVNEFVRKPFRPEEIFASLERAIKINRFEDHAFYGPILNTENEIATTII